MFQKKEGAVNSYEGCLSFPDVYTYVRRYKNVTVKALDLKGKHFIVEGKDGELLARAIQHEFDHLNGILFVDHSRNRFDADKELSEKGLPPVQVDYLLEEPELEEIIVKENSVIVDKYDHSFIVWANATKLTGIPEIDNAINNMKNALMFAIDNNKNKILIANKAVAVLYAIYYYYIEYESDVFLENAIAIKTIFNKYEKYCLDIDSIKNAQYEFAINTLTKDKIIKSDLSFNDFLKKIGGK